MQHDIQNNSYTIIWENTNSFLNHIIDQNKNTTKKKITLGTQKTEKSKFKVILESKKNELTKKSF